jgi:hypothetical protein
MRLMRAPLAEPSRAERLPWPLVSQYDLNAERVVFAQPNLAGLTSCRLADLSCEPVAFELPPENLYHWRLGPRSLFVRASEASGGGVARYDFATRSLGAAVSLTPSGAGTSIAVSPDESELLVVREEGPAIDLMLAK